MAKSKGVVNSQMGGAFPVPSTAGRQPFTAGPAPFNQPRARGGIPVTVFYTPPGMPNASKMTPTQTAGRDSRSPRPGTTQRKYGTSDT